MAIACLLYADDLVILSESKSGLQASLDKLDGYCDKWALEENINKTKIMCMNCNIDNTLKIRFGGTEIERVSSFEYLGIVFNEKGDKSAAEKDLNNQAMKALFKVARLLKDISKIKVAFHLFDHIVKPILMYGCEVWGPINLDFRLMKEPKSESDKFFHTLRQDFPIISKL